jgi:hypothetical protein
MAEPPPLYPIAANPLSSPFASGYAPPPPGYATAQPGYMLLPPQQQQQPAQIDVAAATLMQLQMQMHQLQSRLICVHRTLDVMGGSVNEIMSMMHMQADGGVASPDSATGDGDDDDDPPNPKSDASAFVVSKPRRGTFV